MKKELTDFITNGDLKKDIPRHRRADSINIEKDSYYNGEEQVWVIDVNDDSYVYYSKSTRDSEYDTLKMILN